MNSSSYSQQAHMVVESSKSLHIKQRTMDIRKEDLKLIVEQIVDFESFNLNGYPLWNLLKDQEWCSIFDMLNGLTYPCLVKDFWVKVEVYDEISAYFEVNQKVVKNISLRRRSVREMGLKEFEEVEIRSVVTGIDVTIIQNTIVKLLSVSTVGKCTLNTKENSPKAEIIKIRLFENSNDFGKVKNMKTPYKLLFKILIGCMIPT
ncbi:unnamed protein product [Lathyrus oleraceus]